MTHIHIHHKTCMRGSYVNKALLAASPRINKLVSTAMIKLIGIPPDTVKQNEMKHGIWCRATSEETCGIFKL